jgi:hypothetical protein
VAELPSGTVTFLFTDVEFARREAAGRDDASLDPVVALLPEPYLAESMAVLMGDGT